MLRILDSSCGIKLVQISDSIGSFSRVKLWSINIKPDNSMSQDYSFTKIG